MQLKDEEIILNDTPGKTEPAIQKVNVENDAGSHDGLHIKTPFAAIGQNAEATGLGAIALGNETSAPGNSSFAAGSMAKAPGDSSCALGDNTQATGKFALATGASTTASGENSLAANKETAASGVASSAFGDTTSAQGAYSTSMGLKTRATGTSSLSLGNDTTAEGASSISAGEKSLAKGDCSLAAGFEAKALGANSASLGSGSEASGKNSFAAGNQTSASGENSTAMGLECSAQENSSVAFGRETVASGANSFAAGHSTKAAENAATALGKDTIAQEYGSTAMGILSTAAGEASLAIGNNVRAIGANSIASGMATKTQGNAASAFGNTTLAKGDYSATFGANTEASGEASTAAGNKTKSTGDSATSLGNSTLAQGGASIAGGTETKALGDSAVSLGTLSEASGINSLSTGELTRASGESSLAGGKSTTASGDYSAVLGNETQAGATSSLVIGQYNPREGDPTQWKLEDPLFAAGNGDSGRPLLVEEGFEPEYSPDFNNALRLSKKGDMEIAGAFTPGAEGYGEYFESQSKVPETFDPNTFTTSILGQTEGADSDFMRSQYIENSDTGVYERAVSPTASDTLKVYEILTKIKYKNIAPGKAVVMTEGGFIRAAASDEIPLGVVSVSAGFVGGNYSHWPKKYLKDDYGADITESYQIETLIPKLVKKSVSRQQTEDALDQKTVETIEIVKIDGKYCKTIKSEVQVSEIKKPIYIERDLYDATGAEVIGIYPEPQMETVEEDVIEIDINGDPVYTGSGRFITCERKKLNPDFDPALEYAPRSRRPEWSAVTLTGRAALQKGEPTAPNWVKIRDLSDTLELWLIK